MLGFRKQKPCSILRLDFPSLEYIEVDQGLARLFRKFDLDLLEITKLGTEALYAEVVADGQLKSYGEMPNFVRRQFFLLSGFFRSLRPGPY